MRPFWNDFFQNVCYRIQEPTSRANPLAGSLPTLDAMTESLSTDDFDPSILTSDFTSTSDEPDCRKRRLNEELWSHTRPLKDNEPVRKSFNTRNIH